MDDMTRLQRKELPTAPRPEALAKKRSKWWLWIIPILIAAAWLAVYLIIVPIAYGKAVTIIGWVKDDPSIIISKFKYAENILIPLYKVLLLKGFNYVMFGGLIASLFAVGFNLQNKKGRISEKARLIEKEPHMMATKLLEEIKLIRGVDVSEAENSVRLIDERLRNESGFGYGSDGVIDCENEIAVCLKSIEDLLDSLKSPETVEQGIEKIGILSQRCLSNLKMRAQLKRK